MRYIAPIIICFLGLSQTACAVQEPCLRKEAIRAEETIDKLDDWEKVFKAFKRYHHCDDGSIGEGFSGSISVLLANSWSQFDVLYGLTVKNSKFKVFVINHLDETMPLDEYEKIRSNVTDGCLKNTKSLCEEINLKLAELKE